MSDSAMPSIPGAAIAPIDYSPYQQAAAATAQGGQQLDKAFNDFYAFEKAQNKEALKQQAIKELTAAKPHLAKVIRPDISYEDLGRGTAQLGQAMMLYKQMKAVKMTTPDEAVFEQAAFASSEKGWEKAADNFDKQIKEAEKRKASGQELGVYGQIQQEHPDWTQEQLNAEAARRGVSGEGMGPQGTTISQDMAPKAKDLEKAANNRARLEIARQGLINASKKMAQDQTYKEAALGVTALAKNGQFQEARNKMFEEAKVLRAKAEILRNEKGDEKAAEETEKAAEAWEDGYKYSENNADFFQDFAAVMAGNLKAKVDKKSADSGPAPIPGVAAPEAPKVKKNALGLTPPSL